MKTCDLLLSILDITEDDYSYKGQFILSAGGKSKNVDIMELEKESGLKYLKEFFGLDEDCADIRKILMDLIMEKADISSSVIEGSVK